MYILVSPLTYCLSVRWSVSSNKKSPKKLADRVILTITIGLVRTFLKQWMLHVTRQGYRVEGGICKLLKLQLLFPLETVTNLNRRHLYMSLCRDKAALGVIVKTFSQYININWPGLKTVRILLLWENLQLQKLERSELHSELRVRKEWELTTWYRPPF